MLRLIYYEIECIMRKCKIFIRIHLGTESNLVKS